MTNIVIELFEDLDESYKTETNALILKVMQALFNNSYIDLWITHERVIPESESDYPEVE